MKYRGQSGSQDSIVPYVDSLLRVVDLYPVNDLTDYLMDMRKYRPKIFQKYIEDTEKRSKNLIESIKNIAGITGLSLLFDCLEELYNFRNGHWQFVQRYIMMNTKYPVATGGTPITSWIPNQIEATLKVMNSVLDYVKMFTLNYDISSDEMLNLYLYNKYRESLDKKINLLKEQIAELQKVNYDVKICYFSNFSSILSDNQPKNL
jgi:indoleamine 2,3-dioxygenase